MHLSTSLKSVAEARETAERRSRKLSLNRPTRARGGAFGPGSPMAMAARATRAGGFPEPDDTRISSAGDESDCPMRDRTPWSVGDGTGPVLGCGFIPVPWLNAHTLGCPIDPLRSGPWGSGPGRVVMVRLITTNGLRPIGLAPLLAPPDVMMTM